MVFTFVYVNTYSTLGCEAFLAETLVFYAFGVVCAVKIRFAKDVHVHLNKQVISKVVVGVEFLSSYLFTGNLWGRFGSVALGANAVVSRHGIFANGMRTAWLL